MVGPTVTPRSLSRGTSLDPSSVLRALADALPAGVGFDEYGSGTLVETFERDVATLLGKEAAVFCISGRVAQLAALRVHADERGRATFGAHWRSHIVEDENDAAGTLFGLRAVRVGGLVEPYTLEQLRSVAEPLAAVTLELPLRRAGYRAPEWSELVAIAEHAKAHGAAFHLDGARLWETAPSYDRSLPEICALADTVYVSFYKSLGGLAGAALVGDAATIAAARGWIGRAGCTLYRAFPYVIAARLGVERELPRMHAYYERAKSIAHALRGIEGLTVSPDPPVCNAFVAHVAGGRDALVAARDLVAERDGIELFARLQATSNPASWSFEVIVGANALDLEVGAIREAFVRFTAAARDGIGSTFGKISGTEASA
jgi:threonine aldolase